MSAMYLVCWFDRHSDPQFGIAADRDTADREIREIMRSYDGRYEWVDAANLPLFDDDYDWIQKGVMDGSWIYYVAASNEDGPHGYILEKELLT